MEEEYICDPNLLKELLVDNAEDKLRRSLERLGLDTHGRHPELLDRFCRFLATPHGRENAYKCNISK
jgi:hypothetical protein